MIKRLNYNYKIFKKLYNNSGGVSCGVSGSGGVFKINIINPIYNNNNNKNLINNYKWYSTTNSEQQQQSSYEEQIKEKIEKQKQINKINKIALKKFFLKVHPDLFFQFPIVKKTNDISLRELHGFLEDIKSEKLKKKSYDMKFYYLDNNVYDNEKDIPSMNIKFTINNTSSGANFEKISYQLQDAQNQIQNFFKFIGIKEEFILHSMIGNSGSLSNSNNNNNNNSNINDDSLLNFVKNFSNYAREQSRIFIEQEREIDLMYTYFYMEHKIRVLFQDHDLPLADRKNFLKKLERLLNKLSPPRENSNDHLVNQIFDLDNSNSKKKKKRKETLESMDLNDDMIDEQGDQYQGFGMRLKNNNMREQVFEPFGMFSGSNKEQFSGWQHIKSGYITPESNPKNDNSSINDKIEGVSVVFSPTLPNGIDLEGRLILNQNSSIQSWSKTFKTFKPSLLIENLQKCKNRQAIERQLSKYFNVGFIFTDYTKQNDKPYLDLLNRLISIGNFNHQKNTEKQYQQDLKDQLILETNQNEFKKSQFINNDNEIEQDIKGLEEISIKIIMNDNSNNTSTNDDDNKVEAWKFDSKLGVINVPLNVEYNEIKEFLKENHQQIKKDYERHKINQRNLAQLELTFKRQFRLTRLKKVDDSISLNEMVSCLRRLLFNHQPYLPYLYNMKLIIGHENKINFDGSLTIKWDFE